MDTPARQIVMKLGGITAVATHLNVPISTVSSWGRANRIPEWRQPKLLELAAQMDVALSTTDFPHPEERIALGQAA
jgi:hypothetical protein